MSGFEDLPEGEFILLTTGDGEQLTVRLMANHQDDAVLWIEIDEGCYEPVHYDAIVGALVTDRPLAR